MRVAGETKAARHQLQVHWHNEPAPCSDVAEMAHFQLSLVLYSSWALWRAPCCSEAVVRQAYIEQAAIRGAEDEVSVPLWRAASEQGSGLSGAHLQAVPALLQDGRKHLGVLTSILQPKPKSSQKMLSKHTVRSSKTSNGARHAGGPTARSVGSASFLFRLRRVQCQCIAQ